MLMWAHYADSHKGFCVEYDIPTPDEHNINLLQNLLPVIYSDERVSVLNECLEDLTYPIPYNSIDRHICKHKGRETCASVSGTHNGGNDAKALYQEPKRGCQVGKCDRSSLFRKAVKKL